MLRRLLKKIWMPVAVLAAAANIAVSEPLPLLSRMAAGAPEAYPDTVTYRHDGYRCGWTEEDFKMFSKAEIAEDTSDVGFGEVETIDDSIDIRTLRPARMDSLIAPDSLALVDTFRYKYYAAIVDSLCHAWVHDTLVLAKDSLTVQTLDSLYKLDSTMVAKAIFEDWYASLDRKARRKYDYEQSLPLIKHRMDSIADRKDSIKAHRDSIATNTERILETYAVPDSLYYNRFFTWTHERDFHKMNFRGYQDTTYNYHYYSHPFQREDVDASWLGVSGSPVQYFNFAKRKSKEDVSFYEAQESWSYSIEDLPLYNTKTPYTELQYFGTAFSNGSKSTDNLHIMTSQNITPALNYTLLYNRFGGDGMLDNENTINKTGVVSANYLGKKYLAHAGFIYNMVSREENGGILDNSWIRDTTVDAREISVALTSAKSKIKKKVLFLDQQLRIPFYFLMSEEPDPTDTTRNEGDVTTAFIGHSTEYSTYNRTYTDKPTAASEKEFFDNTFYYNPTQSHDSMSVHRFDNRIFIRLQPWSSDAIVSKLNVGAGHKTEIYYTPDFLRASSSTRWTSTYVYAGAEGSLKNYIKWDATGHWSLAGDESGDFDLKANASLNLYPFRRARKSPMVLSGRFETSLKEPDYYQSHVYTNHYKWDKDFSKISKTDIGGTLDIERWKLKLDVDYNLLSNNLYYGTDGIIRQNGSAMSILSAALSKNFALGILHMDNRALVQFSSNENVVPLPLAALSSRIYVQFKIQKVLDLQLGGDAHYNTRWYAPAWNPVLGVFHLQKEEKYGNCPYFDVFLNAQWKRACIFVRYENLGMGWPKEQADYFSAHHYIKTQSALKVGMYWPFYTQPEITGGIMRQNSSSSSDADASPEGGARSIK